MWVRVELSSPTFLYGAKWNVWNFECISEIQLHRSVCVYREKQVLKFRPLQVLFLREYGWTQIWNLTWVLVIVCTGFGQISSAEFVHLFQAVRIYIIHAYGFIKIWGDSMHLDLLLSESFHVVYTFVQYPMTQRYCHILNNIANL